MDKEDSFNQVADRLKKEGLIEYKGLFKLFASVTGGKAKVSPGTYTLNTDMDYRALLSGMSVNSSTKAEITITIPEGYTVTQIFQLLEDNKVATVEELTQAARPSMTTPSPSSRVSPWAMPSGWRAFSTRTPISSTPLTMRCMPSTRCW